MDKIRVYISGAITNNPNYKRDFIVAKKCLEAKGFEVLSPIETVASRYNMPRKFCMLESLNLLYRADCITFITEGIKSKGMNIEHDIAEYCDIPMVNYKELVSFQREEQ